MLFKDVQLKNTESPIVCNVWGNITDSKLAQYENKPYGSSVSWLINTTSLKEEHTEKQLLGIVVID